MNTTPGNIAPGNTTPGEACVQTRGAVSHSLDGAPPDQLALSHLQSCPDCRGWQEQAVFLGRRVQASRLDPPVGLSSSVLGQLAAAQRRSARKVLAVRALLVGLAATGLALALPALLWGQDDGVELHAAHEIGSTEVALYAGLLAAALWPRRARGILAVLGAAACLLVATATSDIAAGHTTLGHESPHGIAVAGALLLWALARLVPENAPPVLLPAVAVDSDDVVAPSDGIGVRRVG